MDAETQYQYYKIDFMSAYRNNGNDTELALSQVAMLRDVDKEHLRTILNPLIKKLNKNK